MSSYFDPATNKTLQILRAASAGNYGVLAAIAYNAEHITALISAAETARSPLILLLFPSTLTQLPSLVHAASAACQGASVPVSLHLDHAQDEAQIRALLATAKTTPLFDSIMVDMSHYEHAENLEKTRALTALCHEHGIAVEAESGRINGGEDGIGDTGALEALMTTPEEVEEFVAVGINILAPSIGNIHGDYPPDIGPQLDFDRLKAITMQIDGRVEVALHGTNDFSPELMRKCIAAGARKLNVNKLLLESWMRFVRENVHRLPFTQLIDKGIEVLKDETIRWMEVCGSAGRA